MASSQAQFTSPTAPYSGDHPTFALRLETDSDGRVYACFKTQPGWTYQMESASDISKVFDPEDPSSLDGWTRDAMSFYGAGQEIRTHIYTHPPPGQQPPPVAPDPRPFHFFNIQHFQGRSGSLISWGTGAARRSYLSALTFRSTNGPSYGVDSVYLTEPERAERIGVLSWGHLPYSAALESLPALTPAEASIVAIVEGAHAAIVAKLNAINENLALLSQQATTLPTVPGIKKFFRAIAVEVDTDGDGLPDYIEMDHGLNSFLTDTDGDGYSDLEELLKGSDPRDPNSIPAADAVASNEPYWQVKEKFLSGSWNYVGNSIEGRLRTSAAGIETEVNFAGSPSSANAVLTAASYGYWRKWKATDGTINAEAEYSGLFGSNALDGHHRQVRLFRPQAENNAVSRTALLIKEYENPIGSSPTVSSVKSQEFKISYSQTASGEIEMKPTFVALQKQKEILVPIDIEPDANMEGVVGDVVKSAKAGSTIKHFVSPKKPTELAQDYVILKATGITADQITPGHASQIVEWDGGEAMVPAEPLKRRVNRDTAAKSEVKIRIKGGGAVVVQMTVWVVWGTGVFDKRGGIMQSKPVFELGTIGSPDAKRQGRLISTVQNAVPRDSKTTFTMKPNGLFNKAADIPDFSEEVFMDPDGPLNGTHTLNGLPLSKGVSSRWDVSRRMRVSAKGPVEISDIPSAAAPTFADWVPPEKVLEQFPGNPLVGNDDPKTDDEDTRIYEKIEDELFPAKDHEIGEMSSTDKPSFYMVYEAAVSANETFEYKLEFQDFCRLQIGTKWYIVSDTVPWYWIARFKAFTLDYTPDDAGPATGWINNGSDFGEGAPPP